MKELLKIHQYHQNLCDFDAIFEYLSKQLQTKNDPATLHIYPELFLCGYPLQDICLQKSFIESYQKHLEEISNFSKKLPKDKSVHFLGGLHYEISDSGIARKIQNVMYKLEAGKPLEKVYAKMLLPNYDIFDERKYFTPGEEVNFIKWQGKNIGLMICEDMWPSVHYKKNPIEELIKLNEKFDLVINLSASPFNIEKQQTRYEQGKKASHLLKAPFAYVNLVAGEDEVLFDGGSFVINGDKLIAQSAVFRPEITTVKFEDLQEKNYDDTKIELDHSWEDLFAPNLNKEKTNISTLSDTQAQNTVKALTFGLQEYTKNTGINNFLVALSGGLDSALTLALVKLSLKENQTLEAIYMPSKYSSNLSYELSKEMCERLGIRLKNLPIKFLHSMIQNTFSSNFQEDFSGLADENVQARLRAVILMARANQTNSLVINTSNKSELAVGYSTLYGDSVGALSLIGDLYKTEVYSLSNYINKNISEMIPQGIIDRSPSAELRPDQKDSDSLPPYPVLDTILECFLSYRYSREDLLKLDISAEYIDKTLKLYARSEFKRKQFCPILKIKTKSFGFGYRVPIDKTTNFYFND